MEKQQNKPKKEKEERKKVNKKGLKPDLNPAPSTVRDYPLPLHH